MAQVGRERDEVTGDLAPLGPTLLQRSCREGMAQVVDARPAGATGRDVCSLEEAVEGLIHRARAERPKPRRREQILAASR